MGCRIDARKEREEERERERCKSEGQKSLKRGEEEEEEDKPALQLRSALGMTDFAPSLKWKGRVRCGCCTLVVY